MIFQRQCVQLCAASGYLSWYLTGVFSVDLTLYSPTFVCSSWGLHQGCRCCYSCLLFPPWACTAGRAVRNQPAMALGLSLLCVLDLVSPSCSLLVDHLLPPLIPAAWFLLPSWIQNMFFLILQHIHLQLLPHLYEAVATLFIACLLSSWSHAELWNGFSFLTVTVCNMSRLWGRIML